MTRRATFASRLDFVSRETCEHSPSPAPNVIDRTRLQNLSTHLVQQDVVRAAEGPTALLQDLANGIDLVIRLVHENACCKRAYTDLLADLLVDDNVHQGSGGSDTVLGCDKLLECQSRHGLLNRRLASVSMSSAQGRGNQ